MSLQTLLRLHSSNVQGARYNASSKTLVIAFGIAPEPEAVTLYEYKGVPRATWQGLINACSPGRFVNERIKSEYKDFRVLDVGIEFTDALQEQHTSIAPWAQSIKLLGGASGWF